MSYVEQPVTKKSICLPCSICLYRTQGTELGSRTTGKRERRKEFFVFKTKKQIFTFGLLPSFTLPETTGSKPKLFQRKEKLSRNVGHLASYETCFLDTPLLGCIGGFNGLWSRPRQPAIDWVFVSPPNAYIEILTSTVMSIGGEAFGTWSPWMGLVPL